MSEIEINIGKGMTDSHFHIMEMKRKGLDVKSVFEKLKEADAGTVLDAAVHLSDFNERLSWKSQYERLFFAAGIHPNIPRNEWPQDFTTILKDQISHDEVKAVGETGLDFFREYSSPDDQYELLNLHYELSGEADKPLIFHVRNAEDEMIRWIDERDFPMGGVLHCFPGNGLLAETALKKGLYISFAGNVTFKNAHAIREPLKRIPLDRILLETDAPYLAPMPKRGKNSHPAMIGFSYEYLADYLELGLRDFISAVQDNFNRFLGN